MDPASVEKIAEIDSHVGAAMSGLVADAKTLVDHARVEAQNHTFTYDEPIGVEPLTQGTCHRGVDKPAASVCVEVPDSLVHLNNNTQLFTIVVSVLLLVDSKMVSFQN